MQFKEKEIRIAGNIVSYLDEGLREGTPILFIHGFPFSKEMWNGQAAAFTQTHRVIAYDVRGHGHSDAGSMEFSVAQFAVDLVQFMDALALEKVILCGLSMGGYIAMNVLESHPERIAALILCDTQCGADSAEARDKRMRTIASIRLSGLRSYANEMISNLFAASSFQTKPAEVSFIKDTILRTPMDTVGKTLWALTNRIDTCGVLAQTKIPVLIMVGKEDKITPLIAAQRMHALVPGSTMEIIDGAGHVTNLENPEAFNAQLKHFLGELEMVAG